MTTTQLTRTPAGSVRRRTRKWPAIVVATVALLLALVGTGTASAATTRTVCTPVVLTGQGTATGPLSTTATIFVGTRPIATTAATFTPNPDGSLAGDIVFTPIRPVGGTLIAHVRASFAPDLASFTATGPVTGTGTLSRASGQLRFAGPIRPDGTFTEIVTGTVCVDLSRW